MKMFLREEYFGGILYSQAIPGAIPISQPAWDLISEAGDAAGAEKLRKDLHAGHPGLLEAVEGCKWYGALDDELHLTCEVFRQAFPPVFGVLSGPIRVYLHLTDRCNRHCRHCMYSCGRTLSSEREMSTDEVIELLRILEQVKCPELRITGGEPTVRPDLPDILAEAKRRGFFTMLNTNGVFSEQTACSIADTHPDEIIFSLDGKPDRHDELRGSGAFASLERSMSFFSDFQKTSENAPKLTLNFTFGRHNQLDFEWVVRYAAGLNINVNLMPLRPYGAARSELSQDMLSPEEFRSFTEEVHRLRDLPEIKDSGIRIIHKNFDLESPSPDGKGSPPPFDRSSCGAGSFGLGINPDGRASVCGFLAKDERFIGPSVLTEPFERVWYGPVLQSFRTVVKIKCETCKFYRKSCVGACKAMAIAQGDGKWESLSDSDPYCYAHLLES